MRPGPTSDHKHLGSAGTVSSIFRTEKASAKAELEEVLGR